jgi:hypothetical protein
MKKTITKKLRVQPETLKPLTSSAIAGVAGGVLVLNTYNEPATKCKDDTSCPGRNLL